MCFTFLLLFTKYKYKKINIQKLNVMYNMCKIIENRLKIRMTMQDKSDERVRKKNVLGGLTILTC